MAPSCVFFNTFGIFRTVVLLYSALFGHLLDCFQMIFRHICMMPIKACISEEARKTEGRGSAGDESTTRRRKSRR